MALTSTRRRQFTGLAATQAALAAFGTGLFAPAAQALDQNQASAGVREALQRGAEAAVAQLGRPGGFLDDPHVRIPLPGALSNAASVLRAIGQQRRVDDLVTSMNRAAEAAVPEAKPLLLNAVRSMSVEDAVRIVRGGDTSVTDFFAAKTRAPLQQRFLPLVTAQTQRVDLAAKYDAVAGKGSQFGLVKPEDANVAQYVTRKALDGLFQVVGEQERQLRRDPAAAGSALLKAVFGR